MRINALLYLLFFFILSSCNSSYSVSDTDEGKQLIKLRNISFEVFGDYRTANRLVKVYPPLGAYLNPILPPKRKHLLYARTTIEPFIGLVVSKNSKPISTKRTEDILIKEEVNLIDHPNFKGGYYCLYQNEFYGLQTSFIEYRFNKGIDEYSFLFWSNNRSESLKSEAKRIAQSLTFTSPK